MVVFLSNKMESWQHCIWRHKSRGGRGWAQWRPDDCRKSSVWMRERERKIDMEGQHMGRRLGQYIPFWVSRGECQEPDPKPSAMHSLDSSIKMLDLYHRYPACYYILLKLLMVPIHILSPTETDNTEFPWQHTQMHTNTDLQYISIYCRSVHLAEEEKRCQHIAKRQTWCPLLTSWSVPISKARIKQWGQNHHVKQ